LLLKWSAVSLPKKYCKNTLSLFAEEVFQSFVALFKNAVFTIPDIFLVIVLLPLNNVRLSAPSGIPPHILLNIPPTYAH
jgi:hypothetical protein